MVTHNCLPPPQQALNDFGGVRARVRLRWNVRRPKSDGGAVYRYSTHVVRRVLDHWVEVRGVDGHALAVREGLKRGPSPGDAHPALALAAQAPLGVHAAPAPPPRVRA